MAMYAKVRRMRLREGLSISEIARRTSLARNTIKTWLRTPVRSDMKYQRAAGPKKIGPYEAVLREALAADARRPRRERRTARKLYAHEMLFDAHTQCLTGLGGVAARGIYDNMKTAVDQTPRKERNAVVVITDLSLRCLELERDPYSARKASRGFTRTAR